MIPTDMTEPQFRELLDDLRRYIDALYIPAPRETLAAPRAALRKASASAECAVCENALSDVAFGAPAPELTTLLQSRESTFSEHLLSLLSEQDEKDSAVYRRAQISRQLFHRILSDRDYQPAKSTAIQLALGLRLDLSATQTLLGKAGYALTRSSKSDLVVQYFIEHGEYNIVTINTALYDCGLPLLKTGSVR